MTQTKGRKPAAAVKFTLTAECPRCQHDSPDPLGSADTVVAVGKNTCWNCGAEFDVLEADVQQAHQALSRFFA